MKIVITLWIIAAGIFCIRFNKWNRITGQSDKKEFIRHEITELKGFFKE